MAKDDLISRAAAIDEVEQWAEHGYDVIHWTGIKAMLEIQPTIDAIPVEWLRKWPKDLREGAYIRDILRDWHQEQEVGA